ncbi:MAG: uncharacterized protein QOH33_1244 [Paraburkholderia sp.]|nr:uncharacterized protein [Paraburkholderia sp.]
MSAFEPAAIAAALEALLDTLDDGAVRDLAWLLFSPPLLREQPPLGQLATPFESVDEAAAVESWLFALDRNAEPLRQAMAAARLTRLGRYAECLLAYFLEHGPAPRLIAANVALRRAGRTLGECDFLVESASGRRLHWELAVKCYLLAGGGPRVSLADFVGPNLQDRFDLKLAHLLGHQLPLSAREEFVSLGHVGPWEAQMFVKGWLFYRWDEEAPDDPAPPVPDNVDPHHAHGFWVTRGQWPRFAAQWMRRLKAQYGSGDIWAVLPRLAWLAPRRLRAGSGGTEVEAAGLTNAQTLAERLAQQSGPTMIAALAPDRRDGRASHWRECARGFVVPDDWPERARAFAGGDYHQR